MTRRLSDTNATCRRFDCDLRLRRHRGERRERGRRRRQDEPMLYGLSPFAGTWLLNEV
jgi:hypothetical protein